MTDVAKWCILRTSAGRTIPLAKSLADAGFVVWTPIAMVSRRIPRRTKREKREAPLMPTFVFADAAEINDLVRVLRDPISPHPAFSIFHVGPRVPVIADLEVAELRAAEDRARGRKTGLELQREQFPIGCAVRIVEGVATGLEGEVVGHDGKSVIVIGNGRMRLKIATFMLRTDAVHKGKSSAPAFAAA